MANQPFNRTIINTRERPLSSDLNRQASDSDRAIRDVLMNIYTGRGAVYPDGPGTPPTGFIGEAFKLRPASPASMILTIKKGMGFLYNALTQADINGIGGLNDLSSWKPAVLNADFPITISAAPSAPNSRYDLLEVATNRLIGDSTSRDVLNPSTGVFEPNLVNKTLYWDYDGTYGTVNAPAPSTAPISLKVGVAGNPPTPPSGTAGYTPLAIVLIDSAPVSAIDSNKILDQRNMLFSGGVLSVGLRVRSLSPYTSLVLESLQAPPGIFASALWTGYSGGVLSYTVYVFSGNPTGFPTVVTQSVRNSFANPSSVLPTIPALVSIDAPGQTALAGVNANPAIKVAIGQTALQFSVSAVTAPTDDAVINHIISLNG